MDATFFQDICVSLQSDPLALKFKDHSEIPILGDYQAMKFQFLDSEIIDSESRDHLVPCPWIHRSHEGEMPQYDIDPRFMFKNGLLYYQRLLYVSKGPCRLQVLQSRYNFLSAGHFGLNKTMELISKEFRWPQM